ncbi:type I restriction enzyme S subunit [Alkalispirillum mobile]|uniref:Type I restriction enzyme S subunit n=1 Tax=Alkalispirillum mobile TaxID=85925 RepID=A0A498CG97_9GAMM|nr:restriction endonuclease subunit S [Alkalispirillum mobile]RLK51358.1 type I restriction enzyme S subunit [Alkalispirillum mobile]
MAERSEAVEKQVVRDGSAAYAVKPDVATAEDVPHGYKRTEVGLIPEDWEVEPLGEYVTITSGESPSLLDFSSEGFPYFKVEQLGNSEKYLVAESTPYHFSEGKTVASGSLVFAKRGAAIALNKIRLLGAASFMDTNLMALTPNENLEREYLYYQLGYIGLWRFADTTSVPQINNKHVKPLPFPLPRNEEQRAIATALSDADALIESLDRLIAKKRAIKQAAMQQLLTGQTRLPGFTDEWETKRLGEFVSIRNQKVMPSSVHPDIPCIELEHIGQGDGRLLSSSTAKYSTASKYQFRAGDVLFGRLRSYLRKYWLAEQDGICTTEIWPLMVDSSQAASGFLLGIVQTDRFNESASISYGTHMPRADWKVLKNFEVSLPSVNEQTAIANVLSDMDTEIEALERRRNKARQSKKGMMQQLLTGRTRLV